jgi:hypothetical protein
VCDGCAPLLKERAALFAVHVVHDFLERPSLHPVGVIVAAPMAFLMLKSPLAQ